MKQVSDAYLLGISEGRSLLRSLDYVPSVADMEAFADNCSAQLQRGFDKSMADTFRGERDFWRNQIRKAQQA